MLKLSSLSLKLFALAFLAFPLSLVTTAPSHAENACEFYVPDSEGQAVLGPSFDRLSDGFTRGLLDCDGSEYRLMIMTIDIDTSQKHIGVRDDPLFSTQVVGALETVGSVAVSNQSIVHVMARMNASDHVGVRRGFVNFATLCDREDNAPLDCSWGTSRIKFRTTSLDTDADEVIDKNYHELSVYHANGRLHMVTFWTPHRGALESTAQDWIAALEAFGVDVGAG